MKHDAKKIIGILLAAAVVLVPAALIFTHDSQEEEKQEKLYKTGNADEANPVELVVNKEQTGNRIAEKYEFESDLAAENPTALFEKNSQKVSEFINNPNNCEPEIDEAAFQMLSDFIESYLDPYISKEIPDLAQYYDLSSDARKENKLLVEAFAYQMAAAKSNTIKGMGSSLGVKEVTPIDDTVDEVLFYLQTTLHTNNGDESSGTWFVAHIAKTSEEPKLLKVWIQDYAFEMMQNKLTKDYLNKGVKIDKDALAQYIRNDIKVNQDNNAKGPAEF